MELHPARDLIQHIVGVTPAEPGFTKARICPPYGLISRIQASVPTPDGSIEVAITGGRATVSSPVPYTLVDTDGREKKLPAPWGGLINDEGRGELNAASGTAELQTAIP